MLILPIAEPWFSMVLSGIKKEEYREIKPYYISRFQKIFQMYPGTHIPIGTDQHQIILRNGYNSQSPSILITCSLTIKTGKEEWGAEPEKEYFTLVIHKVEILIAKPYESKTTEERLANYECAGQIHINELLKEENK